MWSDREGSSGTLTFLTLYRMLPVQRVISITSSRTEFEFVFRLACLTPTDHPEKPHRTPADGCPRGRFSTCVKAQRQVPLTDPHSNIS